MKTTFNKLILIIAILPFFGCVDNSSSNQETTIIKIGYVSPRSGHLTAFSEVDNFIVDWVKEKMNKKGITVDGKKAKFEIVIRDSKSNPERAREATYELIDDEKVDIVLAAHTPETVNPVAAVCESTHVPCITTIAPNSTWLAQDKHYYAYHFFWDTKNLYEVFTNMWDDIETNKVVGLLCPDDVDGNDMAVGFKAFLQDRGYKVVDAGRYPNGTKDFSKYIQTWKNQNVEILTGIPVPPDWINCWKQSGEMGFNPKMVSVAKGILFPSVVNNINGNATAGLTSEVWWSPSHPYKSSLSGNDAASLADAYQKQWTQPIGYVYALFEVAFDAVKRAGSSEHEAILKALDATSLNTMVGKIEFDDQNLAHTPLVGGQWNVGSDHPWDLKIVNNKTAPEIDKQDSLSPIFY